MDGTAAWAATRPGLGDDLLITAIVERLIAWQWPDGGWNCDKRPAASDASFNESLPPLRALAAWSRGRRGRLAGDARAAAERAAEFLLVHRVDRSHRTLELAHPALERLRWPPSAVLALRPAAGAACPAGGADGEARMLTIQALEVLRAAR